MKQAALVTGGAIRLGKAIALDLARHGFDIALHYNRSAGPAEETAAEIRALGVECATFAFDLGRNEGFDAFMQEVIARFPHLALLVNSASGYVQASISETQMADFDQQFAVNLRAPFFLTQAYGHYCGQGNIINIIDNKIAFNQNAYAAYLLTKKALAELTKMSALEWAPAIRVNGVAPGVTLPAGSRSEEYIEWRKQGIPLKMQGSTSNISQAILSLIHNNFISGQILVVDGAESITNVGQHAGAYDQTKV